MRALLAASALCLLGAGFDAGDQQREAAAYQLNQLADAVESEGNGAEFLAGTPELLHGVTDPWGGLIRYFRLAGGREGYLLISLGADGRPGGNGDDADLVVYRR